MENGKKTMVIGASTNPTRYSYRCIHQLTTNGHPVVAIGLKDGEVAGNTDPDTIILKDMRRLRKRYLITFKY